MSLENKLNGSGHNFNNWFYAKIERVVDTIDGKYLTLTSHLAEKWQNTTSKNKTDLQTGLYICAFANLGVHHAMNPSEYFSLFTSGMCGLSAVLSRVQPQDEERIMKEVNPTLLYKGAGVFAFTIGVTCTIAAISSAVRGYVTKDASQYYEAIDSLSTGLGILSMAAALYLHRVNPGDPPRRPKKKPLMERMKETIEKMSPESAYAPVNENSY